MSDAIEFINVTRQFGDVYAVKDVSINIQRGEFFSMLGPSGSGKTTCLRLIAGFEQANSGSVIIHGKDATNSPPYRRDVNTVFQDYALFPHLNIQQNVEYGLMVKGVSGSKRAIQAKEALKMVDLEDFSQRKPSQLSGGQRQRVALARALVNRPKVLLLDEPLGALDQKLREQMQSELKSLQRQLGITFIFVTHDQNEALSMSDRVAVFNQGKIQQIDTARDLYNHPKTRFVAEFVGTSNVLSGQIAQGALPESSIFSIRPEHVLLNENPINEASVKTEGIIKDILYRGSDVRVDIEINHGQKISALQGSSVKTESLNLGERVQISWLCSSMVTLEKEQ
ncbi:ABC transporter ATP-binding protein [Vibrio sp. Vb2880]|uniref:ABC transporter ATP-binding protein n=1 Tax=Vibrio TaxID=662 RepID=UPI00117F69C9|nr:ABC transporter ATP-binding protein [Vibrio furnissii]MBO0215783.1 ABC transporter ATP-binding protein [Vibrio sp. Vb2880]TRN20237.1 polyamine ABC transporter ATP-binding protein [Vibrio furnissii]